MKRFLLIAVLFCACNKKDNSSPKVSAVNGCVTCHTVYNIIEKDTKAVDLIGQSDSTICNVPDSVLNNYIAMFTYSGPPKNVLTDPNNTETIKTTCK